MIDDTEIRFEHSRMEGVSVVSEVVIRTPIASIAALSPDFDFDDRWAAFRADVKTGGDIGDKAAGDVVGLPIGSLLGAALGQVLIGSKTRVALLGATALAQARLATLLEWQGAFARSREVLQTARARLARCDPSDPRTAEAAPRPGRRRQGFRRGMEASAVPEPGRMRSVAGLRGIAPTACEG